MNQLQRCQANLGSGVPRTLSRRRFAGLFAAPLAASLAAACGGGNSSPNATPSSREDEAVTATSAPSGTTTTGSASSTSSTPSAGSPKHGGTLRIAVEAPWVTLDPPVYTNFPDRQICYALYDSLVSMDEDLNIIPDLAIKWEVSSDALTWTFTLATGITFHDGTPFNAQAVKFNIDRLLDPDLGSRLRQELAAIETVEVTDDTTVTISLTQPFTPLLSWFADVPGMMSSPTAIQKWGKDYGDHPVGTGPFIFQEQVKGDHLTLQRNDRYWKPGLPYLDSVIYQPVPDPSVRVTGLRTGALDLIVEVPNQEVATLKEDPNVTLVQMEGTRWRVIHINQTVKPLDNKAIRQALNLGIDREAIVKAVYFGNATPAYGPISPVYKAAYDPDIESYALKYDPDKAKQKLAEGGHPNGFEITLLTANDPESIRICELVKDNWAAIGVNVTISPGDSNAVFAAMGKGDFELELSSWTPRPDPDGTLRRHFHSESPLNYQKYKSDEADKLLDGEQQLPPGQERTDVFHQLQRILVDDAPWVYLVFEMTTFGMRKSVQGFPLIPDTLIRPGTVWLNE